MWYDQRAGNLGWVSISVLEFGYAGFYICRLVGVFTPHKLGGVFTPHSGRSFHPS